MSSSVCEYWYSWKNSKSVIFCPQSVRDTLTADDPFAPPSHDPNHYVNGETTFHFVLVEYNFEFINECPRQSEFFIFHNAKRKNYTFLDKPFLPPPSLLPENFSSPLFRHFENRHPP